MGRDFLAALVFCPLLSLAAAAQPSKPVDTIPVDQVHAGMHGVAYTVFKGTKPEAMEVKSLAC